MKSNTAPKSRIDRTIRFYLVLYFNDLTKTAYHCTELKVFKVCPNIFLSHIWTIFNSNTHTCGRSAKEIDERKNFQDIFTETILFFTRKITETKTDFLRRLIWRKLFFVHLKVPRNTSHKFSTLSSW